MDIFRTPDERFEDLPGYEFESHYVEVDGLRLHYLDEGAGDPVVCFHGEPTWSYLYRKIAAPLSATYRVIAPDLVGFGRSDKPTDRSFYSYDRHCELVSGLLNSLDLSGATVVVQDWGGPIGLRWAVENAERVARLVIMNTGLFTGEEEIPDAFLAWRSFAESNPDLPIGFVLQGATATELAEEVVRAYEAPFPTAESKAGAAQFPLIVPLSKDDPGAAEMKQVAETLAEWEKPVLVLFSDSDPIFTPEHGQLFVDNIPGAGALQIVEGGAHFLQEDRGTEIAAAIDRFLSSSYSSVS